MPDQLNPFARAFVPKDNPAGRPGLLSGALNNVPSPVAVPEDWEAADPAVVAAEFPTATLPAPVPPSTPVSNPSMTPDDFDLMRVVGQGAFGKVFQVRHKVSHAVYAMKVMKKELIVSRGHEVYVEMERDVLTAVHHPYIITLRFSFQTPSKLYLVLDFQEGGHLFYKLWNEGIFDEGETRIMAAELVSAIGHLHSLGMAHRDLKPENILLDSEGHVKLTDFGLAKALSDDARSNSFIGTMEYMAPEIVSGTGHGKEVDWWSLGILIFEMLTGKPPFEAGTNRQLLQRMIVSSKPKLPKYLSSAASNIIRSLLTRDAAKRLGAGPNGLRDIMTHPFFKGLDWTALANRAIQSPFRPVVASSPIDCLKNFDSVWTDMPVLDSPAQSPLEVGNHFRQYSYTSANPLAAALAAEQSSRSPRY